jgi:sulfite reductase alpha subunit-like flavoprotein
LGDDQHDFGYEAEFDPWLETLWDNLFTLEPGLKSDKMLPEDSIEDSVYNVELIKSNEISGKLNEEELKFLKDNSDENGKLNTLKFYNDPIDVKSQKLFGDIGVNERITPEELRETDDKETRHVELNFGDQDIKYNPGDV